LVANTDYDSAIDDFNLFNIKDDPYEQHNLVQQRKNQAVSLKTEMDLRYNELIQSSNLMNPPRIQVGSDNENPVFLNRNDAGGERGIWDQEEVYGKWRVSINEAYYNVKFRFVKPVPKGGKLYLETGARINQVKNDTDNVDFLEMKNIFLPKIDCDLIPFYMVGNKKIFPFWVEMQRLN
jgi:arylsulfatase